MLAMLGRQFRLTELLLQSNTYSLVELYLLNELGGTPASIIRASAGGCSTAGRGIRLQRHGKESGYAASLKGSLKNDKEVMAYPRTKH
jgi:hypothetical protein